MKLEQLLPNWGTFLINTVTKDDLWDEKRKVKSDLKCDKPVALIGYYNIKSFLTFFK